VTDLHDSLPAGRLSTLARDYPDWDIQRVSLHPTWVAEFRRGTLIRVIAAHDLDDLRSKLEQTGASRRFS
jgi:hypothetical protein